MYDSLSLSLRDRQETYLTTQTHDYILVCYISHTGEDERERLFERDCFFCVSFKNMYRENHLEGGLVSPYFMFGVDFEMR